jgi:hypothetical protein
VTTPAPLAVVDPEVDVPGFTTDPLATFEPGSVLLAYVTDSVSVTHSFTYSLVNLLRHDVGHEDRVGTAGGPLPVRYGAGGLPTARNLAVTHMLNSAAEWLLWLDTDMGFAPDTLERLLAAADPVARPVVGALCFGWGAGEADGLGGYRCTPYPTLYGWGEDPDGVLGFRPLPLPAEPGVVRVAGTGSACVLIHRSALVAVRERFGPTWYEPVRYSNGQPVGEDLSLCFRLAEVRVPVHVDTAVQTSHAKTVWVQLETYARHALAESALTEADE